jgi:DHA1 family bicyclomycin/chloramphenicol resistance-like MFS transporter
MAATVSKFLLFLLVAMTALGPMSMQIFLPALPAIRKGFAISPGTAQLTVSVSIIAVAIMTLSFGPLSDRFGRRPVTIAGLVLFLAGSALCVAAPGPAVLIAGRAIQGAGGASGMVIARAVVRDLYQRDRAAAMLAYLGLAVAVAPMVAPALGGVITDTAGWRFNFVAAGGLGLIVLAFVAARMHETHTARTAMPGFAGFFGGYGRLLADPGFRRYTVNASFGLAVFFAFMSGAPYVMADVFKRPATEYGLYFIMLSGGLVVGSFAAGRLSARLGIDRMILLGSAATLVAAVAMVALLSAGYWHPLALFGPGMVGACATGMSMPNAQAGAVSVDPARAGAASGLIGFVQMLVCAVAAQAAGMLAGETPYPLVALMSGCAAVALLAAIALPGRRPDRPHPDTPHAA